MYLDAAKKAILPRQHDGYNCGIGICTTIGILMRDFLKEDESCTIDNLFCKQVMPMSKDTINAEMFYLMPKKPFLPMPRVKAKQDFLQLIREEWFVLFDRLAEYQFWTGPHLLNRKHKPLAWYNSTVKLLVWPRGKQKASHVKEGKAKVESIFKKLHDTSRQQLIRKQSGMKSTQSIDSLLTLNVPKVASVAYLRNDVSDSSESTPPVSKRSNHWDKERRKINDDAFFAVGNDIIQQG